MRNSPRGQYSCDWCGSIGRKPAATVLLDYPWSATPFWRLCDRCLIHLWHLRGNERWEDLS
jgi:hypothetical protein